MVLRGSFQWQVGLEPGFKWYAQFTWSGDVDNLPRSGAKARAGSEKLMQTSPYLTLLHTTGHSSRARNGSRNLQMKRSCDSEWHDCPSRTARKKGFCIQMCLSDSKVHALSTTIQYLRVWAQIWEDSEYQLRFPLWMLKMSLFRGRVCASPVEVRGIGARNINLLPLLRKGINEKSRIWKATKTVTVLTLNNLVPKSVRMRQLQQNPCGELAP